ncbi:MAG TPA: hypothetical protein VF651_06405 [Gammaproteobacteria bacterium]
MTAIRWSWLLGIALGFAAAAPAWAASPGKDVKASLGKIKSVAGGSVLSRIQACGIKFADGSYQEAAVSDIPDIGAHKGDVILEIYIDVPPMPGGTASAYRGIVARWVISKGVARPNTRWAQWLQEKEIPIGSADWMNC